MTLIKMTSACATQVHARELADPGFEAAITYPAKMPKGVRLVRFVGSRVFGLTPVETGIEFYEEARLPAWSHEMPRGSDKARVWTVDASTAVTFLNSARNQPGLGGGSVPFKYCADTQCDAIITSAREFDSEGHPYHDANQSSGCVVGKAAFWNPIYLFARVFQRVVMEIIFVK